MNHRINQQLHYCYIAKNTEATRKKYSYHIYQGISPSFPEEFLRFTLAFDPSYRLIHPHEAYSPFIRAKAQQYIALYESPD